MIKKLFTRYNRSITIKNAKKQKYVLLGVNYSEKEAKFILKVNEDDIYKTDDENYVYNYINAVISKLQK